MLLRQNIKAVIFDLDGTLISVTDRYYSSYVRALDSVGINTKLKKHVLTKMRRAGMSGQEIMAHLLPTINQETILEIDRLRKRIVSQPILLSRDYLIPGVKEFLEGLKSSDILLGVLTLRSSLNVGRQQLDKLSILKYFDEVVIKRNVNRPLKEKYKGLLEMLGQFKVQPRNTILVDDTEIGIIIGHKAGVITVGVLSGLSSKTTLEKANPDIILRNVTDLRIDKTKGLIL